MGLAGADFRARLAWPHGSVENWRVLTRARLPFRRLSVGLAFVALGGAGCSGTTGDDGGTGKCLPPVEAAGAAGDDGGGDVPPADVQGNYTVTLTNVSNSCSTVMGWIDDAVTTGIGYDIRQSGSDITAEAQGNAGVYFVVLTGSDEFSGSVRGNSFELVDVGPNVATAGSCSYTVNAVVSGSIDGDTISGKVIYKPVLSADPACNPDCAPYACEAEQDYAGTRASN